MTGVLLAAVLSLAGPAPEALPRGEIVPRVSCEGSPEQSYALYLPASYETTRTWPILYLYDPRRRGAVAAERFRDAAERYGWILASSNNTVSDTPGADNSSAMSALWTDTHRRFSVDPRRVYASGFSGGARLACLLAQRLPGQVAGVIACGGGFPDSAPPKPGIRFAVFGAVGNVDFNYGEMRRLDRTLEEIGATHRLSVFDAPPAWCPPAVCGEGIEWMELQAMKSGARSKDPVLVERILVERLERASLLETSGRTADAHVRYSEIVRDFAGLTETKTAEAARARLDASSAVAKALAAERRLEESEARLSNRLWADLTTALASDPPPPLQGVVNRIQVARLRKEASGARTEAERLSAARVLEQLFAQTAFYLPRDFVSKRDFPRAELATGIAAQLKPDRAGTVFYNLACFRALAGDRKGALASLRTAVRNGFREIDTMETDPDLAALREEKDYRAIVDELKKPRS